MDLNVLFRQLSENILCITCLDLFLCSQFLSLYSLYCWGISAGEEQPNLAAPTCPPTCPRRTRFIQNKKTINIR